MHVVTVRIQILPEHVAAFIAATADNHAGTRGEPGNLRFDVLRAVDDPNRVLLYEVYRDQAALRAHQQTAHYLRWRETVAPWMAVPRAAEAWASLAPDPWA